VAIIGIDLGTTNSLAAKLDNLGRPQIIHNVEGSNLTPSVVHFKSEKEYVVGAEAKACLGIEKNVFSKFKRDMGSSVTYEFANKNLTPVDLSALVLAKIKKDTQTSIGNPDTVVITVPANFRNEAREATLSAARLAGLDTEILLNEPTAAALYYAHQSGTKLNGIYVVYDLGGGTLDVSIIKAKDDDIEVLSSEGLQKLGGEDFDDKVLEIVSKKFKAETGKEFDSEDYGFGRVDAEEVKKALSSVEEKKIRIVGQGISPTTILITRKELEEAISGLIAQTEMLCEAAIVEANISITDINEIFLAGGSSRIPLVKKTLGKLFAKEPITTGNPDEAIALGAAIYAGYKTEKNKLNPIQAQAISGIKFQEIAPAYFGTISRDTAKAAKGIDADLNNVIISKNEKIPCSRTETFYTVADNQTNVKCNITQSPNAETDPRFVRVIWQGDLALPPNRPEGQEIQVTYSYHENGTMHAEFLDVGSKKKTEVDIASQSQGNESTIDINNFIVE
jgi:molecular chaperone DnaK